MKTKLLLAVIVIAFSMTTQARTTTGVIVVGDSITSKTHSWPGILRNVYGYHVKSLTQGGRMAMTYELPADLATVEHNTIFIALGTNDGLAINGRTSWSRALMIRNFRGRYHTMVDAARNRGFRVILMIPAIYDGYEDGMRAVRSIIQERCAQNTCINLDPHWVQTTDGIHPQPELSAIVAGLAAGAL